MYNSSYVVLCQPMFVIRADILINDMAFSITREAFGQFRDLKNMNRPKPFSDSLLLDKLGIILSQVRLDRGIAPESYEIDGMAHPLFYHMSRKNEYRLAIVTAKYPTLVSIAPYVSGLENTYNVLPLIHEIDFHGKILCVTDHALYRFVSRWIQYEKDVPKEPLKYLGKILNQAIEDTLSPALRVLRILNNGFVAAQYLRHGPWRMVIIDKELGNASKVLLTFERRLRL